MKKKIFIFLIVFFFIFICETNEIFAQNSINVEFTNTNANFSSSSIPSFIQNFYISSIGIAGIFAFLMIVWGGIQYQFAGASPQREGEAKDIILNALWGLLLLLGAYIILRTVNPVLVELNDPSEELGNVFVSNCADNLALPECTLNQDERDTNGKCICRKINSYTCPIDVKIIANDEQSAKDYLWTKESGYIPNENITLTGNEIPKISLDEGCPKYVKIPPGSTPYFLNCNKNGDCKDEFVLNLEKQPKFIDENGNEFPFPLPIQDNDGNKYTYIAEMQSLYLNQKDPQKRALCATRSINIKRIINGQNKYDKISLINNYSINDISVCLSYSNKTKNESVLSILKKNNGSGNGGSCDIGKGYCAPTYLGNQCPTFGDPTNNIDNMSRICNAESGGNALALSGVDYCPGDKNHPFSIGLMQINVIANGSLIETILGTNACKNLYNHVDCDGQVPCKKEGKYNCNLKSGKEAQWEECRDILSDPIKNLKIACSIYTGELKNGKNPLKKWGASNQCGLL